MQTLEKWYIEQTTNKNLEFDNAQLSILQQLDGFIHKFNQSNFITKWFSSPKSYGYYIYGSVGCGKSMIMNKLYKAFPDKAKTRMHFHQFIYEIQHELNLLKAHDNPLALVAKKLKKQYKIIFLDEMLVNDIATAMILNNLFKSLFEENIYIITTSNSKPDELYAGGLMRERFLPAIQLFNTKLEIINLVSKNDYRLLHDSNNHLFIIKQNSPTILLDNIFLDISKNYTIETGKSILICERQIPYLKKSKNIIWFSFDIICGDKRSQIDYLELVNQFEWFIIGDIKTITDKNIARRFILLIDVLYDNIAKISLSANIELEQIYPSGELINEFVRTLSRLKEMQTKEYINKPRITSNIKDSNNVESHY